MDELDHNLLAAWQRVFEKCKRDPAEARRRWRRTLSPTLRRPPRAWCLCLRASDTRLNENIAAFAIEEDVEDRLPHEMLITGDAVRAACAPVRIRWPGVTLYVAAQMLGHHRESLRHWLPFKPGRTRETRAGRIPGGWDCVSAPGSPFNLRYEKPETSFGMKTPIVWTNGPIDPNGWRGQTPHPVWGGLWRHLSKRMDDSFEQTIQRVPRMRALDLGAHFRGWDWLCPGLINPANPAGPRLPCGRRCRNLYLPLPVYTITRFLGAGEGLPIDSGDDAPLRLSGNWHPGWDDPLKNLRTFACERCWNVRRFSIADYRGWNEFVTYLSGGLLYGQEVERPADVQYERKREKRKQAKCVNESRRSVEVERQVKARSVG
jgi:hypothetical protein